MGTQNCLEVFTGQTVVYTPTLMGKELEELMEEELC